LIGYGFFRRGIVPPQLVRQRVMLQETQSLPSTISWQVPVVLPVISPDDNPALASASAPSESGAPPAGADEATTPKRESSAVAPSTKPRAASRPRRAARTSGTSEDEAATMEAIRRERDRAQETDPGA